MDINNKVTIIMPVYNAGVYLRTTLNSIVSQSFNNLEVIIVDDCSIDDSCKIIEEYVLIYSNIIFLKQDQNGGQSKARNRALQIANGDFIYFMDSDDVLPKDAVETLVKEITSDDYDFVVGDVRTIGTNIKGMYSTRCNYPEILKTNTDIINRYTNIGWCVAPWAKLFRKQFLDKYRIKFKEGIILEDELFTFTYLYYSNSAKIIPDIVYEYYIRNNSTMTQKFSQKHLDGMKGDIEGMKSILKDNFSSPLTSYVIIIAFRLAEAITLGDFKEDIKYKYRSFLEKEISASIVFNSMKYGVKRAVKAIMFLLPSSFWFIYLKLIRRV